MTDSTHKTDIGLDVKAPKNSCTDRNCPFHGSLSVRGRTFTGRVVSTKRTKSVKIEWERRQYLPKYERYERRRTILHAHNPPCVDAKDDDVVMIAECRPLSKTKHFVIVEKVGRYRKIIGIDETSDEKSSAKPSEEKTEKGKQKKSSKKKTEEQTE